MPSAMERDHGGTKLSICKGDDHAEQRDGPESRRGTSSRKNPAWGSNLKRKREGGKAVFINSKDQKGIGRLPERYSAFN